MTGDAVRRLTAGTGLAAVGVSAAGRLVAPGDPPGPAATAEQVVRWTLADRRSLLVGTVLVAGGLALAVAFVAGLRALCARAEGAPGILATIAWGSMLLALGTGFVAVALAQGQAFLVLDGDPATVEAFHDARLLLANLAGLPAGVALVAFGAGMLRTGYPARWLGGLAGLAALAQAAGVVALSRTGFLSPSGGAARVGAVALWAWVAVTAAVVARRATTR